MGVLKRYLLIVARSGLEVARFGLEAEDEGLARVAAMRVVERERPDDLQDQSVVFDVREVEDAQLAGGKKDEAVGGMAPA